MRCRRLTCISHNPQGSVAEHKIHTGRPSYGNNYCKRLCEIEMKVILIFPDQNRVYMKIFKQRFAQRASLSTGICGTETPEKSRLRTENAAPSKQPE